MNLKWPFPSQKSFYGSERQMPNSINILWRIRNFTTLTMKSIESGKRKVINNQRKLSNPSYSNGELRRHRNRVVSWLTGSASEFSI